MKTPLIVAHRGASALAPENTLAAFRRALDDGAEGIEFDVRLSADGEAVVFHDAGLKRLTGEKKLVSQLPVAELKRLDVGSWFNRRRPDRANEVFSSERIPTLAETLAILRDFKGLIYIEMKCREAEIERLARVVAGAVEESRLLPQIIVKSFQLEALPAVKKFCPAARTAALFAPRVLTILRKEKRLVNIAAELGADHLSVHFSLATRKLVEKAAQRNLPITIWTADNPRWVRRAFDLGLFAVITNHPARLLAKRGALTESLALKEKRAARDRSS